MPHKYNKIEPFVFAKVQQAFLLMVEFYHLYERATTTQAKDVKCFTCSEGKHKSQILILLITYLAATRLKYLTLDAT